MKNFLSLLFFSIFVFIFTGCANNKSTLGYADNTGPFDEHGNYRDDWADDPTKWRRPDGSKPTQKLARNDQPPANALPIARSSPPPARPAPPSVRPTPPTTSTVQSAPKPKPAVAAKPKPKPAVAAKPKPKPAVAAKPKPKPKPAVTRYTVKKGDTLSAIASRNGSSVAAIQKANNIKGSLIRPGQSLVIPKR